MSFYNSIFGVYVIYRLLQGSDVKNTHAVNGRDVELIASRGSGINHPGTTGSSKVRTCATDIIGHVVLDYVTATSGL